MTRKKAKAEVWSRVKKYQILFDVDDRSCTIMIIRMFTLILVSCLICAASSAGVCNCPDPLVGGNIDLSHLDSKNPNSPTFPNVTTPDNLRIYAYNPCSGFVCGSSQDSAICSKLTNQTNQDIFTQTSSACIVEGNTMAISYNSSGSIAIVTLICDQSHADVPQLTASNYNGGTHRLELRSVHCCPTFQPIVTTTAAENVSTIIPIGTTARPVQPQPGLSPGSVLLIIFFSLLLAYLVFGVIFRALVVGARGYEVVPHLEFWVSLPGLIQDGCWFTIQLILGGSPSSSRAGYSEIDSAGTSRGASSYQPEKQNDPRV